MDPVSRLLFCVAFCHACLDGFGCSFVVTCICRVCTVTSSICYLHHRKVIENMGNMYVAQCRLWRSPPRGDRSPQESHKPAASWGIRRLLLRHCRSFAPELYIQSLGTSCSRRRVRRHRYNQWFQYCMSC